MLIHEMSLSSIVEICHPKSVVFIGCGGEVEEWTTGVTRLWRKAGVITKLRRFHQVFYFNDGTKRCLAFNTNPPWIDHSRLEQWMSNNRVFKCAWLRDYAKRKGIL